MASPWPPRQKRQDVPPKVLEQLAKHPVKGLYQLIDNNSVYCPNPSRTTSLMNFIGRVQTPYREDAYEEGGSSEMSSRPNDGRISLNAFLFIRQQLCTGLAQLHSLDLAHCYIGTNNCRLYATGEVYLVHFGHGGEDDSYPRLTDTPALRKELRLSDRKSLKALIDIQLVSVLRPEDKREWQDSSSHLRAQKGDGSEEDCLDDCFDRDLDEDGAKCEIKKALRITGLVLGRQKPRWLRFDYWK